MYYLFNTIDNSYNCHQENPFTEHQKAGTYEVYYEGELPEGNIIYSFYDKEAEAFYFEENYKIITPEEAAEMEQENQAHLAMAQQTQENILLNAVLDKLKPILTEDQLAALGNFNTTSDDDVAAIEEALDETTGS